MLGGGAGRGGSGSFFNGGSATGGRGGEGSDAGEGGFCGVGIAITIAGATGMGRSGAILLPSRMRLGADGDRGIPQEREGRRGSVRVDVIEMRA